MGSKLNNYITHGKLERKRTGIAFDGKEIASWYRISKNITYTCSLCNSNIGPHDNLYTISSHDAPIEVQIPDVLGGGVRHKWEVAAFI